MYAADTWTRVAARVDRHADAWAAVHHDACQAHARGEQSAVLLDLRMACLERRRGELAALVARLAAADADTVRAAASAVDDLIPPERCADAAALTAAVPLPEDPAAAVRVAALRERLAEARAAAATAKPAEAATLAAEVVQAAEALGFRPLLAEALAVRGSVALARGEYEPGCRNLEDALWLADTVRDDVLLADTMAELVREGDLPTAITELERAIAVFVANPEHIRPTSLPEARFTLARALRAADQRERAAAEARQAAAEYRAADAAQHAAQLAEIDAWLAGPPDAR